MCTKLIGFQMGGGGAWPSLPLPSSLHPPITVYKNLEVNFLVMGLDLYTPVTLTIFKSIVVIWTKTDFLNFCIKIYCYKNMHLHVGLDLKNFGNI